MILTPRKRTVRNFLYDCEKLVQNRKRQKTVNSYHFLVFQNLTARKYVTKYLNKCEFDLNLD